jgi:hypothetical protein
MDNHIHPTVARTAAMRDAETAYQMAKRVPYAPLRAIEADWQRYRLELSRLPRAVNVFQQGDTDKAMVPIAAKARQTFEAWSNKPQADLMELWAAENGRQSPKAVQAQVVAQMQENGRRETFMRAVVAKLDADPDWTARKFVAGLAQRGIYVSADDYGRIKTRGGLLTDEDEQILQLRRRAIEAEVRA